MTFLVGLEIGAFLHVPRDGLWWQGHMAEDLVATVKGAHNAVVGKVHVAQLVSWKRTDLGANVLHYIRASFGLWYVISAVLIKSCIG
jgi:hypothetical protein